MIDNNIAHNQAGQESRTADLISKFLNINKEKIEFFINEFGIERLFNEPQIIGLSDDAKEKLNELKLLLDEIGR